MATIIAGRYEQQTEAETAVRALMNAGFRREDMAVFYLNPAGQHATYSLGGDHDRSAGAKSTGKGVAAGVAAGAAIGVAATPVLGPLGPIAGGLLGAHLGGLVGGMASMRDAGDTGGHNEDPENALPVRHAGVYVALSLGDNHQPDQVADQLAGLGAMDVERAEGTIANGEWTDFDASIPPAPFRVPRQQTPSSTQRA